jgi:hypothetical protein
MASPMRERRAWSTRQRDAESKETAAFEATVAVAKDTVARSGAILSSAKEDLTDHQRWLRAQSLAVQADRARHERWLQRQRDYRLAVARRERTRRRRQYMRQRAVQAIQRAIWASVLFIRSLFLLLVAKTVSALNFVARSIAQAVVWLGARLRDIALYLAGLIVAGARWTAGKLRAFALWIGRGAAAGFDWSSASIRAGTKASGRALARGASAFAARAGAAARASGWALGTGTSFAGAKAGVFGQAAGRSFESAFSTSTRASAASATGQSASRDFATLSAKMSALVRSGETGLSSGYAWSKGRAARFGPALYVRVAKIGRQVERHARAAALRTQSTFAKAKTALPARQRPEASEAPAQAIEAYGPYPDGVETGGLAANEPCSETVAAAPPAIDVQGPHIEGSEDEGRRAASSQTVALMMANLGDRFESTFAPLVLFLRARTRDLEISQMMIISGVVLLVCGGFLLGRGLMLRASPRVEPEATNGIAWMFEEGDLPLAERAVFTLSGTPASFRINGLSISGENLSNHTLTGVQAMLKPDVQRPDLKLTLRVGRPKPVAGEDGSGDALDVVPDKEIPPHTPFKLVFAFPPEAMDGEDGISVEEFFESYGGVVLDFHYESEGNQRALIQYLSPDMLKTQLDEVRTEGGGS